MALEHYERLFEALCAYESRCTKSLSTPDLASMDTQVGLAGAECKDSCFLFMAVMCR